MATIWSLIVNRMDGASVVWKEWRAKLVSVSSGPPDAGAIPMLDSSGQIDPSMLPPIPPGELNMVRATLDFGRRGPLYFENDEAVTTVTGQPWVTATTKLLCQPAMVATADHDPDDVWAEEIIAYATNIVPGVGFDVIATCRNCTWGSYLVDVVGA
jgi:hypothetical protein